MPFKLLVDCSKTLENIVQGYAYFTSETADGNWIVSDKSVEDPTSIPGRILSPLYDKATSDQLIHILYNDEHPDGNTRDKIYKTFFSSSLALLQK
jgi:Deoxyribonuclease II